MTINNTQGDCREIKKASDKVNRKYGEALQRLAEYDREQKRAELRDIYIKETIERNDVALRKMAEESEKVNREEKLGELLSKITPENTHEELLCSCDESTITDKIREWSVERNLHEADPNKQALKLGEEMGELFEGLVKGDEDLTKDAIGDIYVVMTIMAQQLGFTIEECIEIAYDEIKDRRGKMIDGVFVKEEDLNDEEN